MNIPISLIILKYIFRTAKSKPNTTVVSYLDQYMYPQVHHSVQKENSQVCDVTFLGLHPKPWIEYGIAGNFGEVFNLANW